MDQISPLNFKKETKFEGLICLIYEKFNDQLNFLFFSEAGRLGNSLVFL